MKEARPAALEVGGPRGPDHQPAEGVLSSGGPHEARPGEVLRRGRGGGAARHRGAADRPQALRERRGQRALLPEAGAGAAPRLGRDRRAALPIRPHGAGDRRARRGAASLDRQPRLHRSEPPPRAGRRSRASRRAPRGSRPRAGGELGRRPAGRDDRARRAGGARPEGLAEDVGIARHARQRADRAALELRPGAPGGAGSRARGGAAGARARDEQVVERGTPRRLPRLQPEREGPYGRVGLVRAAHARRPRVDAAGMGGGPRLRSGGVHPGHRAATHGRARRRLGGHRRRAGLARKTARALRRAGSRGPGRRAVAAALQETERTSRPASHRPEGRARARRRRGAAGAPRPSRS